MAFTIRRRQPAKTEPVVFEKELEPVDLEAVEAPIPALPEHDIDVPEEPEEVEVMTQVWNPESRTYEMKSLGKLLLVPSGCERPQALSPFESNIKFKSALPRDKAADANLYAMYQTNGWTSRHWVQENLDENINPAEVDKELSDDIPFLLQLQGKPAAGVAQTAGLQPGAGSNNGAPLPPGPGPGRGNTKEKMAAEAAGAKPPPNAAPGTGV